MMGIPGLTAFVDNNPSLLTDYRLHDTKIIIDGNNLYHFLYYYFHINHQYGGDYNRYAERVRYFFQTLDSCGIVSYVVFDGGRDISDRKLPTMLRRARERIHLAGFLANGCRGKILPILAYDTFRQVLSDLNVAHVTCDLEADEDIAALAIQWGCPVLSNDSDFFIYDIRHGFILLDYLNLQVHAHQDPDKDNSYNYIKVQAYFIDSLLSIFPGLERCMVPLFATLQGNDVVNRNEFGPFFSKADFSAKKKHNKKKVKNKNHSGWDNKMSNLLKFLAGQESLEAVIDYIVSFMPDNKRSHVKALIDRSVLSYTHLHSNLISYFASRESGSRQDNVPENLVVNCSEKEKKLDLTGDATFHCDNQSNCYKTKAISDDGTSKTESEHKNGTEDSWRTLCGRPIPKWFCTAVRSGIISVFPLNAIISRRVILLAQVEDMNQPSAYCSAEHIRSVIYGMLLSLDRNDADGTENDGDYSIVEFSREKKILARQPVPSIFKLAEGYDVPGLNIIPTLSSAVSLDVFDHVMGTVGVDFSGLDDLRFVVSVMLFWVANVTPKLRETYVYAIWLCIVKLSVLDHCPDEGMHLKQGVGGSSRETNLECDKSEYKRDNYPEVESKGNGFPLMSLYEKLSCAELKHAQANLDRFNVGAPRDGRTMPDNAVLHALAQFQAIYKATLDLNAMLMSPLQAKNITDIFQGTFIYNMSIELNRRPEPLTYISEMLGRSSPLAEWYACALQLFLSLLPPEAFAQKETATKKKAKKKDPKKVKSVRPEPPSQDSSESEDVGTGDILKAACRLSNKFMQLSVDDDA